MKDERIEGRGLEGTEDENGNGNEEMTNQTKIKSINKTRNTGEKTRGKAADGSGLTGKIEWRRERGVWNFGLWMVESRRGWGGAR